MKKKVMSYVLAIVMVTGTGISPASDYFFGKDKGVDAYEDIGLAYDTEDVEYSILNDGTACITMYYGGDKTYYTIPATLGGKPVTQIARDSFSDHKSLKKVTFPDSIKYIGGQAFWNCSGLTSLTFPEGLETIDENAFLNCTGLTSVTLSDSITDIADNAFDNCGKDVVFYVNKGTYAETFVRYKGYKFKLLNHEHEYSEEVIFDPTCEDEGLTLYTCVEGDDEYEEKVPALGHEYYDAEYEASCTERGYIEHTCSRCGKSYTDNYTPVKPHEYVDIVVEPTTTEKGYTEHTCVNCGISYKDSYVDALEYEYSVLDDGTICLEYYTGSDTKVIIPKTYDGKKVTSIGSFTGCTSITSITIPDSVTSISNPAFHMCPNLTNINVDSANPYYSSADGVLYNKNKTELIRCPSKKSKITIPNSVTSIGEGAFYGCGNLTSITIPNSVKTIDDAAFYGCQLTSITLPNSVTYIGEVAFYMCMNLTNLTIPSNVTSIGVQAFAGCDNLTIKCYSGSAAEKYAKENNIKYKLIGAKVSALNVKANKTVFGYTGKAKAPTVTIKDGSYTLKQGTDYTLSYKNNKNIGTGTVTVTGKGNYTGTKNLSFTIIPSNVGGFKAAATSANAVKLSWNKVSGAQGYIVYQYNNSTKKWVRIAKTGNVNTYTVKSLKAGTTYKYAVKAYKTVSGKDYTSAKYPTITTSTKPAKVSFKAAAASKAVKFSWSKVTGATNYIVYYRVKGTSSWKSVKVTNSVTSKTISGLVKGKTYEVTVKAVRTVNKVNYNGAYDVKTVKVK